MMGSLILVWKVREGVSEEVTLQLEVEWGVTWQ